MPNCIVLGCPHKCGKKDKFPGVIMHAFPRSLDRIKAWLLRTGQMFEDLDGLAQRIYEGKKNSAHRLCSAHFTLDSYIVNKTNKILRPDALPSIFPPPGVHSRRRARKQKKTKGSSQLSNSLPHLLWHESSREEAWTKREYLFQGAETQTDLSCFNTRDRRQYDRSDKDFGQLLHHHPHIFERSMPDAPQSLLAGLKEEQVQFPCTENENGVMPAPQEHPRLLTSIKSENLDEHPVEQHEDAVHRIVIDCPKEEVTHLMFPGLEDQTDSRGCPHRCGEKDKFPDVIMHCFPRSVHRIKAWLLQTGQTFEDVDALAQHISTKNDRYRLCSAHFTVDCYVTDEASRILRPDALPSIFPVYEDLHGTIVKPRRKNLPKDSGHHSNPRSRTDLEKVGPQMDPSNVQVHRPLSEKVRRDPIRSVVTILPKKEGHLTCQYLDSSANFTDRTNSRGTECRPREAEEMPKCIVKGCPHYSGRKNSTPGVTLHMFPKDLATIKKWLLQTNQDFGDLDLFAQGILQGKTGVFRICSAHFAAECYSLVGSQKVLLEGAIPTIFPERDKPSNRMETAVTPLFQNIYLPISLWTNGVSMVSNLAPWGVNQLISPGVKINQDSNIVPNAFGVSVSASAVEYKPEQRPNEHRNPPTDLGTSPLPSFENTNTPADVPDPKLCEQPTTDTKTDPMFPDLSTEKVDKGIQWPEYENNVDGEPWKVLHDHLYKVPHGTKYQGLNRCSLMTEYMPKDGFGNYFEGTHSERELFSMLQYVASVFGINKNKELKTARILNQALEIVSLITGEEWVIVNKNSIHKGVHQLTGEFPVKCGEVAVYFTMDEWSYIDQHKKDYGDFVTDNVPMSRTWEVPEHWDSDPMTEDDEEEYMEDSPKRVSSPEWKPDSESEDEYDGGEASGESPSADEPQTAYQCDQCEESFTDEQALEMHKLTHVEKCEDCEEEFSAKAELIKHRAENHAVKRFACTVCGIQYDYRSQFIIHQRAHTGEKPFHCDDCGAKFGHRSSLLVHQRRHTEGKTVKCSKCEKWFDKRSQLTRHEKVHNRKKRGREVAKAEKVQSKKKKHKCRKCGKTFIQKAAYKRHLWEHEDD